MSHDPRGAVGLSSVHIHASRSRQLTILIPAFNEEAGIGRTLNALRDEPRLQHARVIVIDDGSRDRTGAIAAEHGAQVLKNWTNLGYGASLKRGLQSAETELVAWFDADGQHSPIDLADMVDALFDERAHAVIGARTKSSHVVRERVFGKKVLQWAAEAAAGREIPDINCGLRVFRREILLNYMHLLPDGFSASTTSTLLFMKRNHPLVFHPVHVAERIGRSTVRQLRDGLRTLHTILRVLVMFNAFRTFNWVSGSLLAAGLIYGVGITLLRGAGFPVFGAMTIILGVQVFCLGVVCDQISAMRLERLGTVRHDVGQERDEQNEASTRKAG